MTARLLTVDEVSELTGFAPYTVRKMARQGRIPSRKIGQRTRFVLEEVERWITELPRSA